MTKFAQTQAIIQHIRTQTDTAVLFYSAGGKDSIALLDMLATRFKKVICYFMYLVKDLEHTQVYIDWAVKKYPNVEIRQIPHFMVDVIKKNGFFCDEDDTIKVRKIGEIEAQVMQESNSKFAFSGMKGVDGFMKRMRLKMWKPLYMSPKGMVYPLALWTNKEVLRYIQNRNLIKPMVYNPKPVSQGVGLDYDTLHFCKKYYPNDLKKILEEYPYAEIVLFNGEDKP
ncbi:hypothetical protein CAPN008_01270 [Capnocytophaga canis]|uniref:phosphoadenosine phosphosulfate reductase domain-containing protein n=1 Tax=Capnocytophaga canis TaxID=1848903 RepID=UPI001ACF7971|nr:phosphoadenosine phosphosulfate reductase family protein [Capnocytophaga canis]GIM60077.1 hypothetical protein CAPN008_01270 [Capnocytophaga canis]